MCVLFLILEPTMKELQTIVVPEVMAEWDSLAISMDYELPKINSIRRDHNGVQERCINLFGDWLQTPHGCTPKSWETLLKRIKAVPNLFASEGRIRKELLGQQILTGSYVCM